MRPSLAQHEYWVCFVSRTKDAQSHHQQENLTQCSDESSEWLPRTIEQKHKFHLAGDMAFGEDADIFQAFGIMGMVASGIPLFGLGVHVWWLAVPLWIIFLFSFSILYVAGGHAFTYGPHLFIFGFINLARGCLKWLRGNERD